MTREALIVLARAPEPGRVKTRLIPALGEESAGRVHAGLLEHTLAKVSALDRPVRFHVAGDPAAARDQAEAHGLEPVPQAEGDLGARMAAALAEVHGQGFDRVVLVGSDCPVLDEVYLQQALLALDHADFVLGPAEDGGYVLLGSARAEVWWANPLAGVRFGGPEAEADTRNALIKHGRVARLALRWDLDDVDDWHRLQQLQQPPAGAV